MLKPCFSKHNAALAAALLLTGATSQAAEVVDMAGRHVQLPAHIDRVFAAAPPVVPLIYALNPNKLITVSFPFKPEDAAYITPAVLALPPVGRYLGEGSVPNPELLARAAPQLTVAWEMPFIDRSKVEQTFQTLGTPGLFVHLEHLADYPAALELVGAAIGEEARAAELASVIRSALQRVTAAVSAIPASERKRVYFAEGASGLLTECGDSFHAEVIALAGAENVMTCENKMMCGREPTTLAQIKVLDPDVIVTDDAKFFASVTAGNPPNPPLAKGGFDPTWSELRAVREGRVYRAPTAPFDWMGRPPSFMRVLAMQWLANLLYPERFAWDAAVEIPAFYAQFLGVSPASVKVDALLGRD
ncbi:ABC transporter substrate-binding protein [Chromatium okenii]|uniref:ABC transporter substrate-binding protein n=1 Tax=Chromatium okenii TaxID=61644 RepID=UPI0019046675|nr:ABC transporter substrate-binding protein [Chromatium okenii]MBK1642802.1 ABC transporter substrate-binding protein [Chromatium okenii]